MSGYPHYETAARLPTRKHHHHLCPTAKTGHDMACVCEFIQTIIEDTLGQCTVRECGLAKQ